MIEIPEQDFRELWDMVILNNAGYVAGDRRTEDGEIIIKDGKKVLEFTEDGKYM